MDPIIPFLEAALDPEQARLYLQSIFPETRQVSAAVLLRHKLGRRALIAYHLKTSRGDCTLIGKIRAKGTDVSTYDLQNHLWHHGFDAHSPDGYCVPEPIGLIPDWRMWVQRQVPGVEITERLGKADGVTLMPHVSAIAHKLHTLSIATDKLHTLADELRILHERLPLVWQQYPEWRSRITQVLKACDTVAATLPANPPMVGIHRDFYSDQILVDGDRFWLVDLDLYCQGHPALDIGNFIAHITEQSLRQNADLAAMVDSEIALKKSFIEICLSSPLSENISASELEQTISAYEVFTLARHIYISHRIPERNRFTAAILELCERRLTNQ